MPFATAYKIYEAGKQAVDAITNEEAEALFAPDHTPARQLPVFYQFFFLHHGIWYYAAHDRIHLWMLSKTYDAPDFQPWIDAAGNHRTDFVATVQTRLWWKYQSPAFRAIMWGTAQPGDEQLDSTGLPQYAYNAIPDGTPVTIPPDTIRKILNEGLRSYIFANRQVSIKSTPTIQVSPRRTVVAIAAGSIALATAIGAWYALK